MPRARKDIQQLCRVHTESAIKTIVGIMNQPNSTDDARLRAASYILDRAYGKAAQAIQANVQQRLEVVIKDATALESPSEPRPEVIDVTPDRE